jgi:hypothetical protein
MQKNCANDWCKELFEIHVDEVLFLEKLSFRFGDTTFHAPHPVFCPNCRLQIRACHRNEQYMYRRSSSASGKNIVALYHREAPYEVYSQEEWRSDAFDPLQYGQKVDCTRSFFEQCEELQKKVPRVAMVTVANENSDFTTGTGYCKNCYLINSSEYAEDCYYGKLFQKCKNSMDCSYLYNSELCYECFSVYGSYNCAFVSFSQNCQDCLLSSNLQSCTSCCLCTNLSRQKYCFLNEQLTKEGYEKRVAELLGSHSRLETGKKILQDLNLKKVHKYANIVNCESCTGDYIENSQHCMDCYDVNDSQDCRYVTVGVNVKDNYDCSNMYLKPELCYNTLGTIEAYNCAFCLYIFYSQRMLYCDTCYNCSDCFGCIGLTRKKFCIFNVQYTKEEYDVLVPRLIEHMQGTGEWGLYFPPTIATFAYNESLASEYFPLTREEAKEKGFSWRDKDVSEYQPQTIELKDNITDVEDSIVKELLACSDCGKNYHIIPQELAFYRRHHVPIPRFCPECRQKKRIALRNPRTLWPRQCAKCSKDIQTTYAPDRPEIVYCEECYLETVY